MEVDDWLQKCVKYLNGTAYDVINGNTELLNFFASKTITIPPVPDYKKIMKKEKRPYLIASASETLETNKTEKETKKDNKKEIEKAYTRGFETEVFVSKYFARFGPGGIYLTDLNILELMRGYRKETDLQPFLPDVKEVHEYLKDNSGIEIDGIFIHPKVGLAIVEVKAVEYSKETSEQQPNRLPQIIFGVEGVKKQLNNYEKFVKGLFNLSFSLENPILMAKVFHNLMKKPSNGSEKLQTKMMLQLNVFLEGITTMDKE
uniref:Uncharacterized protein n=1 Tax=Plectus sambesii TaxID=2011161 RepID=A0A914X4B6_9BILA